MCLPGIKSIYIEKYHTPFDNLNNDVMERSGSIYSGFFGHNILMSLEFIKIQPGYLMPKLTLKSWIPAVVYPVFNTGGRRYRPSTPDWHRRCAYFEARRDTLCFPDTAGWSWALGKWLPSPSSASAAVPVFDLLCGPIGVNDSAWTGCPSRESLDTVYQ